MRYPIALPILMAMPAITQAHSGGHDRMGFLEGIAHMLSQHYALGIATGLIVALTLLGKKAGIRPTCNNDINRRMQ